MSGWDVGSGGGVPAGHHAAHESGGADPVVVDAAAGTPSLRTLGGGATQAAGGTDARLSDTRTPTAHAASHKSGGSDPVKLNELAAPTASVALNSQKLTGVLDPTAAQDAATKSYVDANGAPPAVKAAALIYAAQNFR